MKIISDVKREQEKRMVSYMVTYYSHKKHKDNYLCSDCQDLITYAFTRIDNCPHMETKTFCSNCKTPCYHKALREQMRCVMRFAGPRMLLHKPFTAIRHIYYQRKVMK